jgi:hypothetical protein
MHFEPAFIRRWYFPIRAIREIRGLHAFLRISHPKPKQALDCLREAVDIKWTSVE